MVKFVVRADLNPFHRVSETNANGTILVIHAHRPNVSAAPEFFETKRRVIRVLLEDAIDFARTGLNRQHEPVVSAPEGRADFGNHN